MLDLVGCAQIVFVVAQIVCYIGVEYICVYIYIAFKLQELMKNKY